MANANSNKFKFKSSGINIKNISDFKDATKSAIELEKKLNIGIRTPLQFGTDSGEIFAMNTELSAQFSDNLKNLILTNHGERLGLYDFGANLRELLTNYSTNENFESSAIERITVAVNKWMPFINLLDFSTTINENRNFAPNSGIASVTVTLKYSIPQIENKEKILKVNLFVI